MKTYTITLPQLGRSFPAAEGTDLKRLLGEQGLGLDAPCGGKGTCGKCRVTVNGEERLACRTTVDRDMAVLLPEKGREAVLTEGAGAAWAPNGVDRYAMAFDVGTTTVVGYLLDGRTGETLETVSAPNPQRAFGADVISRIQHALTEGAAPLRDGIRGTLRDLLGEAAGRRGVAPDQIGTVGLVGNTCMHHLLLDMDVKPLATPPYRASVTEAMVFSDRGRRVRVLPNISGFVGADTVGCLLATDFARREGWTLLVDIGTNGEMVLGRGDRRVACSTAAGPAFEGAKIECGMRGAEGAIDHVWLEDGALRCSVIGGGKAVGLCGSGLLDAVAALLEQGVIAPNGRMREKRVALRDGIYLSQKDVRQVQLAKAAIRAGIELMAKAVGIGTGEIDRLLLAGAFGNHLSPRSACAIGLLPPALLEKIESVGNAAGEGAKAAALSAAAFEKAKTLAAGTDFLELATLPAFQNTYISLLDFREVDLWKN